MTEEILKIHGEDIKKGKISNDRRNLKNSWRRYQKRKNSC